MDVNLCGHQGKEVSFRYGHSMDVMDEKKGVLWGLAARCAVYCMGWRFERGIRGYYGMPYQA